MKKIAVIPAVLVLAGMLAGCGGAVTYAALEGPEETLGINVWPGVEEIYAKGDFSAFPKKDDEKEPAKKRRRKKKKKGVEPATAWQRRLQTATENLLDAVTEARRAGRGAAKSAPKKGKRQEDRIREGKLSYDEVSKLEPSAWRIQLRARELARTVEGRARERRIAAELAELRPALRAGRAVEEPRPRAEGLEPEQGGLSREEEEFAKLGPVAERIEVVSAYFWRATAIHSKMDIGDSWTALLTACRGLPGAEALTEPLPEPEPATEGEVEGEGGTETGKKGEAEGEGEAEGKGEPEGESEAEGTGEVGTGPGPGEETGPGAETESNREAPGETSPAGEL